MSGKGVVHLWNLALSAIGVPARVSQEDEVTLQAEQCRLWYPIIRDSVLAANPWNSCRGVKSLALLAERDFNLSWQPSDPEPPWAFVYGAPDDFIHPRFLDSFSLFDVTVYSEKKAILTNVAEPVLTYTRRVTNVSLWEDDLYLAIAYGLGAAVADKLHGKNQKVLNAFQIANSALMKAQVRSANENHQEFDHVPDWFIARGISATSNVSRFIYPNGPLLSFAAVTT